VSLETTNNHGCDSEPGVQEIVISPLSVNEYSKLNNVKVFTTLARNQVTIEFESEIPDDFSYRLINMSGQVWNFDAGRIEGNSSISLLLQPDVQPGAHILQIISKKSPSQYFEKKILVIE